jgi:hypothetical protein
MSKLYQYIASGKPIVMSQLPNFIELPYGVVYTADSADDFVCKIRNASEEDCDEYCEIRFKIASENTWKMRGEQLHTFLKDSLGATLPEHKHTRAD